MRKPSIAMKLSPVMYDPLLALANAVIAAMTGNANFLTPLVALATIQTATDDVTAALATWRQGGYGSHSALTDLQQKSLTLHQLLTAEAKYVEITAQLAAGSDYAVMRAIMDTSGFTLAADPNPQGVLEMVSNFHRFVSRSLNPNQVKLKWGKPLNVTSENNVKDYVVLRSATNDFSAAEEIAHTTRTSYIDVNTTGALVTWTYWVLAVNGAGNGAVSDPITVRVPPM